jgi:hypothetical protein
MGRTPEDGGERRGLTPVDLFPFFALPLLLSSLFLPIHPRPSALFCHGPLGLVGVPTIAPLLFLTIIRSSISTLHNVPMLCCATFGRAPLDWVTSGIGTSLLAAAGVIESPPLLLHFLICTAHSTEYFYSLFIFGLPLI